MPLKFEVDSLDGLDEQTSKLYEKHEASGKFRLSVEGIDPADELKKALAKEREEKKTAIQKAKELEEAARKAKEDQQKQQGQFKELYEKTLTELESERKQAGEFQRTIQKKELENYAARIAGELTRDTKRALLLQKEIMAFLRFESSSGEVKIENAGIPVEREKLIEKMKVDFPFLVDGSGASGGGAGGSKGGGASGGLYRSEMSAADKAAFIKEHGQQEFLKLPKSRK